MHGHPIPVKKGKSLILVGTKVLFPIKNTKSREKTLLVRESL